MDNEKVLNVVCKNKICRSLHFENEERIRWTHNDLPLFPRLGVMASKIREHSCMESNNAGNNSYAAELFVNSLPSIYIAFQDLFFVHSFWFVCPD